MPREVECMKLLLKFTLVLMLAAGFLPAGCFQQELFDLAKNGVPLVYAVVTTAESGSNRLLMVTDGDDYYREYALIDENTMMNITDTVTNIAVSRNGEVYICTAGGAFYRSNHGLGYMKQLDAGGPAMVAWMATDGDSLYVNDNSPAIYRYSEGWSSFSAPGTPVYMGNEDGVGGLYFIYMPATFFNIYRIHETSYSLSIETTIMGGAPYFFSIVDGGYWVGADDKPYYKSAALSIAGPAVINGYCRIGSSLYLIGNDFILYKSNRAKTDMYSFSATPLPANPSYTFAFGESKIAIGTGTAGYYLMFYNLDTKTCSVYSKSLSFTDFNCITVR
jgi:hypothetical protein